jgi:hypothetical protein
MKYLMLVMFLFVVGFNQPCYVTPRDTCSTPGIIWVGTKPIVGPLLPIAAHN